MLFYISGCLSELRNRRADCFWVNCTDKCQRYTNMHRNLSLLAYTHKSLFLFFFVFTFLLLYVLTYKRIMSSFVCQLNSDVLLYTNSDSWENLISHLIAPSPLTAGYILSKWVLCSLLFLIYYPQVLYKLYESFCTAVSLFFASDLPKAPLNRFEIFKYSFPQHGYGYMSEERVNTIMRQW